MLADLTFELLPVCMVGYNQMASLWTSNQTHKQWMDGPSVSSSGTSLGLNTCLLHVLSGHILSYILG